MSKHLDGNDALEANRTSILEIIDWQPAHGGILVQMPENLGPWLIDNGSLTRKLVALSKDQFEVQVVRQEVCNARCRRGQRVKDDSANPCDDPRSCAYRPRAPLGFCSKYSADDDDDGALGRTSNAIKPTAWRAVVSGSFNDP